MDGFGSMWCMFAGDRVGGQRKGGENGLEETGEMETGKWRTGEKGCGLTLGTRGLG